MTLAITRTRRLLGALAVTGALCLTGCGGSDSGSDSGSGSDSAGGSGSGERSTDDAVEALQDWISATQDGDDDACDLETDAYAEAANAQMSDSGQETLSCPDRVAAVAELMTAFGEGTDYTDADFAVTDETPDTVTIEATYSDGIVESYDLVYEDGDWLVNSEGGTGGDASGGASEEEIAAQTAQWVENWCDVQPGQTREEAIEIMGEPTGEFTAADDATPQINYEMGPYSFTVFLDTDAVVDGFYANYDSLGDSDLAKMPCVTDGPSGLDRE